MFFAVSGFLITSTSLRRWGTLARVPVQEFYALRFSRIAPLLLLVLAVLSALHTAALADFVVPQSTGGLSRALLAALTFHVNVLEARRGYLPGGWDVLWSLSVEEMFYVFFPLISRILGRGKPLIVILAVFVAVGPYARSVMAQGDEIWQEYSYLGGMDAIALGCLTALVLSGRQFPRSAVWTLGGVGTSLLALILCSSLRIRHGLDMTICAAGTCMVIAAAAQSQWKAPLVLTPLLKYGQRSYEVYLTHMFVVFGLFNSFVAMDEPLDAVPLLFAGVILLSGVLGELVGRFYSEPMNRLLRQHWSTDPASLGAVVDDGNG